MRGIIDLTVSYGNIRYNLEFKHNISVLLGNSGTGKTALCSLISQKEDDDLNHSKSAIDIKVNQNIEVRVLPNVSAWQALLAEMHNTLVFIDETCSFVISEQFASAIKGTTNYYVIINRASVRTLPYSVFAIYELIKEGNTIKQHQIVGNSRVFDRDNIQLSKVRSALCEDNPSSSGTELYSRVLDIDCNGAGGNANVAKLITKFNLRGLVVIVDAATFGPYILDLLLYRKMTGDIFDILLPESTEWVLLNYSYFSSVYGISNILYEPWNHIDYTKYFDFEKFFEAELVRACKERYITYSKSKKLANTFDSAKFISEARQLLGINIDPKADKTALF